MLDKNAHTLHTATIRLGASTVDAIRLYRLFGFVKRFFQCTACTLVSFQEVREAQ